MPRPHSRRRRAPGRPGFSLVLSLTVMAMLLLLCISVAALMAVELRIARSSINQAKAKLNALAGARLALGQLQTLSGPDQRITATADLIGQNALNQSVPANATPSRRRHWTGVWSGGGMNTEQLHDWSPLSPNKKPFAGWLVSYSDTQGAFSPAENPLNRDALNTATGSGNAALTAVTLPENPTDVLLIGAGTAGADGDARNDFVSAPRVALPGDTGGFAYWVGDEGVKATLNVADPLSGSLDKGGAQFASITEGERAVRMGVAGRRAAELIKDPKDGSHPFQDAAKAWLAEIAANQTAGASPFATGMENNILTAESFPLWYNERVGKSPEPESIKRIYHHATAFNRGLLTDTRNGGFKVDLSSAFELDFEQYKKLAEFAASPDGILATADAAGEWNGRKLGYVFELNPSAGGTAVKGPTWDLLRNHYRLYKREREASAQGGLPVPPAGTWFARGAEPYTYSTTGTQFKPDAVGGPTATGYAKLNFSFMQPVWSNRAATSLSAQTYTTGGANGNQVTPFTNAALTPRVTRVMLRFSLIYINDAIGIGIDPVVYIHNPYNVPLSFAGISVDFASVNNVMFTIKRSADDKIVSRLSLGDIAGAAPYGTPYSGGSSCKRGFSFRIMKTGGNWDGSPDEGLTLQPGETRIASCTGSGDRWQVYDDKSYTNSIPGDIITYSPTLNFRINARAFDNETGVASGTQLIGTAAVKAATDIAATPPATAATPSPLKVEISTEPDAATPGAQSKVCSFDVHLLRPERYIKAPDRVGRLSLHGQSQIQKEAAYYDLSDDHLIQRINVNLASGPLFSGKNNTVIPVSADIPKTAFTDGTKNLTSGKTTIGLLDIRMRSLADGASGKPSAPAAPAIFPLAANPRAYLIDPRNAEGQSSTATTSPMWQATFEPDSIFGSAISRDPADPMRGFWGLSYDTAGQTSVILHEVPQLPAVSLAALGQADVALLDNQPALHLGNSYPLPTFTSLDKIIQVPTQGSIEQYDLTFAMNEALYDRYFFSGLAWGTSIPGATGYTPPSDPQKAYEALLTSKNTGKSPLLNKALRFDASHADDAIFKAPEKLPSALARQLYVPGAFNVNSTSVEAWKALLGCLGEEGPTKPGDKNYTYKTDAVAPYVYSRIPTPPLDTNGSIFANPVKLTRDQIEKVAAAIVEEVKARGPFMSLADFVNRRIDSKSELGGKGALQAALDKAGLPGPKDLGAPDLPANAKFPALTNYAGADGAVSSGAGQLSHALQMDVLNAIGGVLTPRSDTFIIRAYGDSGAGPDAATAVCEMTVMRTADWIDSTANTPAVEADSNYRNQTGTQPLLTQQKRSSELNAAKSRFGRRYQILSSRWLAPSEI